MQIFFVCIISNVVVVVVDGYQDLSFGLEETSI